MAGLTILFSPFNGAATLSRMFDAFERLERWHLAGLPISATRLK